MTWEACTEQCAGSLPLATNRCLPCGPLSQSHDCDDFLAPALALAARNDDVVHIRMVPERRLDFLCENLLPARIDRHRVATENIERSVFADRGSIAWHRVPNSVDHRERARCFLCITEIPEWHAPCLREPTDRVFARGEHAVEFGRNDTGARRRTESPVVTSPPRHVD